MDRDLKQFLCRLHPSTTKKKIEEWVIKFNQSPNVTVKYVKGDHHYFVEEERAAETAGLINDFIK